MNDQEDLVNSPRHYIHPSGIEAIEITRHETFLRGNIIKYVLRAPYKGTEIQDLEKAAVYLQWEIERAKRETLGEDLSTGEYQVLKGLEDNE
jgi:hypothetical protein